MNLFTLLKTKLSFVIFFHCVMLSTSFANQFNYVFPPNIAISLNLEGQNKDGIKRISGTIESLLGTLKNIELFFDSSEDLEVECGTQRIETITEHHRETVAIVARPTGKKPGKMGSWVKLGVHYHPDYEKILATLEDTASYPVEYERQRLKEIAISNREKKEPYTEVVRIFLGEGENKVNEDNK